MHGVGFIRRVSGSRVCRQFTDSTGVKALGFGDFRSPGLGKT